MVHKRHWTRSTYSSTWSENKRCCRVGSLELHCSARNHFYETVQHNTQQQHRNKQQSSAASPRTVGWSTTCCWQRNQIDFQSHGYFCFRLAKHLVATTPQRNSVNFPHFVKVPLQHTSFSASSPPSAAPTRSTRAKNINPTRIPWPMRNNNSRPLGLVRSRQLEKDVRKGEEQSWQKAAKQNQGVLCAERRFGSIAGNRGTATEHCTYTA